MKGSRTPKKRSAYPEYAVWHQMIARCHNESHRDYPLYGGRGVSVCERWRGDFSAFIADMGERPSCKHSIDRIDNDGDYSPENCRWATPDVQTRNKRSNRILTYQGLSMPMVDWAKRVGMPAGRLQARLTLGMSVEEALTKDTRRMIEFNGERMSMSDWARKLGVSTQTLASRLDKYNMPLEKALTPRSLR